MLEGQGEGNALCHHSEAKGGKIWRLKAFLERKFVWAHLRFWFISVKTKILELGVKWMGGQEFGCFGAKGVRGGSS